MLAIAWTLTRWGLDEAVRGVLPLLAVVACLFATAGTLVVIAWIGRQWGALNTLQGVTPWAALAACGAVALAAAGVLAAVLLTYELAGPLVTMTCLLWLGDSTVKRCAGLWQRLGDRGKPRAGGG
jgi:hypothetical protein